MARHTLGIADLLQALLERGAVLELDAGLVRLDRGVELARTMQGCALACVTLCPVRINLNALPEPARLVTI
jgi:hypothetical protein